MYLSSTHLSELTRKLQEKISTLSNQIVVICKIIFQLPIPPWIRGAGGLRRRGRGLRRRLKEKGETEQDN
jgi:hypothetical protein